MSRQIEWANFSIWRQLIKYLILLYYMMTILLSRSLNIRPVTTFSLSMEMSASVKVPIYAYQSSCAKMGLFY